MIDEILKDLIQAAADAMRTQERIDNDNKLTDKDGYRHVCRSYIAKLSNAYHALSLGDPQSDLVDFYTAAQLEKEKIDRENLIEAIIEEQGCTYEAAAQQADGDIAYKKYLEGNK